MPLNLFFRSVLAYRAICLNDSILTSSSYISYCLVFIHLGITVKYPMLARDVEFNCSIICVAGNSKWNRQTLLSIRITRKPCCKVRYPKFNQINTKVNICVIDWLNLKCNSRQVLNWFQVIIINGLNYFSWE